MSKSKNTFKRKGRKDAFKYVKKMLENSIVLDSAQTLYDYNRFEAREFIRYLFGDKDGNKLIDIIDDMPKDEEESDAHNYAFDQLLDLAIENGDIKSLSIKFTMTSAYFEDSKILDIDETMMKAIHTARDFREMLYIRVVMMVSQFMSECSTTIMTKHIPEFIKKEYTEICSSVYDYRVNIRMLINDIRAIIGSMLSDKDYCTAVVLGTFCFLKPAGYGPTKINVTKLTMTHYDACDEEIQKTVNPKFDSSLLSEELMNAIYKPGYEAFSYFSDDHDDGEVPVRDAIIAFTSNSRCGGSDDNIVHVGHLRVMTDTESDNDPVKIDVPACWTEIHTTHQKLGEMLIAEFKEDAIIIDSQCMFYPIKDENDNIQHKYYRMSPDEAVIVLDIVSNIEPGEFFASKDHPETQKKINTLLKMLQKACPDVDIRSHDVTLVNDFAEYHIPEHALHCVDIALTDTTEDVEDEIVAFISDKDNLSLKGSYVHVGQIFATRVTEDHDVVSMDVPTECTKLGIRKETLDNRIITHFKKDAIIIDAKTVFYPIIKDGAIKHNYSSLSADEVDMVRDIINDIEPGKFFTSGDYPETQKKINTMLAMLQKDCPDVDFKAHDITLVEDRAKYDDAHALNCIDVALTDTAEE